MGPHSLPNSSQSCSVTARVITFYKPEVRYLINTITKPDNVVWLYITMKVLFIMYLFHSSKQHPAYRYLFIFCKDLFLNLA